MDTFWLSVVMVDMSKCGTSQEGKLAIDCVWYYSKTSDSGPSDIGTVYNRPLNKVHCLRSQIFTLPIAFTTSEKRTNSLQRTKQVNLYYPQRVPCTEVPLYKESAMQFVGYIYIRTCYNTGNLLIDVVLIVHDCVIDEH